MRTIFVLSKKILLCISITALLASQALALATYQSVEEMIAAQKAIRVLMDDAPNYGNQAATINLMNRLRQMNFQGTYEVIYPDGEADKMVNLFDLPQPLPDVFHYEDSAGRKIDLIRESYYSKQLKMRLIEPVQLAISGAHDMDSEAICDNYNDCGSRYNCENTPDCTLYKNFAELMNANTYVQIQPWFRQAKNRDYISVPGTEKKRYVTPSGKYWIYPYAKYEDAKAYLAAHSNDPSLLPQKNALKTLFALIDQQTINFQALYGYPLRKANNMPDQGEFDFPQNILQILTAERAVQLSGAEFNKPVVAAVFYDYKQESAELINLLQSDNWGEYEEIGGEQARSAIRAVSLNSPHVFSTASLDDPDVIQKMQSLQPGQILLLSMGSLPKVIFDGLYSYTGANSWPAIREGEGSFSLLLQTGKPHFRCVSYINTDLYSSRWEMGFSLIKDADFKKQIKDFYGDKGFCAIDIWKSDPYIYKKLAANIIDAKNPNSMLSQYFSDISADQKILKNDRIYRALEEAMKAFQGKQDQSIVP